MNVFFTFNMKVKMFVLNRWLYRSFDFFWTIEVKNGYIIFCACNLISYGQIPSLHTKSCATQIQVSD